MQAKNGTIVSLIVTYLTALAISLIMLPFYPLNSSITESFKQINWASYALGAAIIGPELGFLLAYRSGWNMSVASLFANSLVAVLLIFIGIFFLRDRMSVSNLLGVAISIVGIILIRHK